MSEVSGIPADAVGRVVQDFIDNGAEKVTVRRDDDGTFTVGTR